VEILVDVVAEYVRTGTLRREQLLELVQPDTLPDFSPTAESPRIAGENTLRAARDLALVEETDSGWTIPAAYRERRTRLTRELVLDALDARVLGGTDVEPYFALFYSYLLGLGSDADERRDDKDWAASFNEVLRLGAETSNPFNATKVRGLWRWFPYAGLGWADGRDVFQCEPYERVRRALPRVFGDARRLEADVFASRLAESCPELDGGRLYRRANPRSEGAGRVFSLGLAQALVALHEDGVIVLDCPADSRGWDLSAAEPPNDGVRLRSSRLDAVERVVERLRRRPGAGGQG
jgi:hypothetical protein